MEHTGTAGQPKHFLQPCLLLLLQEQSDYGYELVARLRAFGVEDDSGTVYRALRALEASGAVVSRWKAPVAGPARRMYDITAEGRAHLDAWAAVLDETRKALDGFLTRHSRARADRGQCAVETNGQRAASRSEAVR